jgi:hypothetical protein
MADGRSQRRSERRLSVRHGTKVGLRPPPIKIDSAWAAARGDRLDVAGIVGWTNGTPLLTAPELKGRITGTAIAAPLITSYALANDRTESLHYVGINPVGLLVTTSGKVTRVDTTAHVFYIDDGTRLAANSTASVRSRNQQYAGVCLSSWTSQSQSLSRLG